MRKIFFLAVCLLVSCQAKVANENVAKKSETATNIVTENATVNNAADTSPTYSPTPSAISIRDVNSRIGNVEHWSELCFIIQNPDLLPGDRIQMVMIMSGSTQEFFEAEIVEKKECRGQGIGENELQTPNMTGYLLKSSEEVSLGIGIGLVNPFNRVKVAKGIASMDIDNDERDEYFRSCAGNESVLLTVWKGKPLIGKPIWHSLYRLNYDTEPTCNDKDYEGMPDE